jgi:uncharacterized membrane protein
VYAVLAIIFGAYFVFVTPPLFNADEANHLDRVYQLSTDDLRSEPVPGTLVGGNVPTSIVQTADLASSGTLTTQPLLRYHLGTIFNEMRRIPLKPNVQTPTIFPDTALYTPIVYAPQIVAVKIVSVLNKAPVYMIYLGRLFGLLASVAIFAYAIRRMPFGKWALVAIGLLPMTVDAFASFGADAMTIAYVALFVAMIADFVYNKKLVGKNWDSLLLLVAACCVALSKTTYAALLLLLVALPLSSKQARERRQLVRIGSILVIGALLALLWQHATRYVTTIALDPSVIPRQQFSYIAHNPWLFVHQPLADALLSTDANGVIISMFGQFAWLTAPLPYLIVILEILVLTFCCSATIQGEFKKSFNLQPLRRVSALTAAIGVLAVCVGLYTYWTPVGARVLDGLQGRYFIPILLISMPAMKARRFIIQRKTAFAWATYGSLISLATTALVLTARFYIRT